MNNKTLKSDSTGYFATNEAESVAEYYGKTILQFLEDQANHSGQRVALIFREIQLTYTELNRKANQLAALLKTMGVGPGVKVGILLERSLEMVIALLGVLKAGGCYIPLDFAYPQERIAFIMEDAELPFLITCSGIQKLKFSGNIKVIEIDQPISALEEAVQNPVQTVTPEDLAYIIYTSGSTGKPKGVQILHRSVANLLQSMLRQPGLGKEDRLLALTTMSFDISVLELFLPLVAGATVVLADRETAMDPKKLADQIELHQITIMQATPATWRMLLDSGWKGTGQLKALCGGEAMGRDLANRLLEKVGSVWNMYGPTETTVWSMIWKVEPGDGPVYLGQPIDHTQIYVLDESLSQVGGEATGELFIGGAGLSKGYLNRPELTAERFIENPFRTDCESRLYKTGDLVRYYSDGQIEYLGRTDLQVKIRGYRVEIGEIEAAVETHPLIKQAVVIGREDPDGIQNLLAFYQPVAGKTVYNNELRPYLSEKLPEYMIPSYFIAVDELPLTPNGKVDRKALNSFEIQFENQTGDRCLPKTGLEKEVAAIWSELLKIEPIGLHEHFLDLGGHSLMANRLTRRINDAFQIDLTLVQVLSEGLTIADMVRLVENKLLSRISDSDLKAMMQELENLSEAEIAKLLVGE